MESSKIIYKSQSEFWPFYLSQHQNKTNRILHLIGFLSGSGSLLILLITGHLVFGFLSGLILGYGFSWIGHFLFERNHPATFQYPLYSFLSDIKMNGLVLITLWKKLISSYF